MIIDNNLTYLNVISEGILQLIKMLKSQYGSISLSVVIANRVDTTTDMPLGSSIVPMAEYEKRLKEKLLVGSLENSINNSEWNLQTASARKDKRLMLADIVCNTFYTRRRKRKFDLEEQAYIEGIYGNENKTIVFSVFESALEKQFKNNLVDNRIGEAVAGICLSSNTEILEKCFALLRSRFLICGVYDIRFQYKFIQAYIEYYINIVRDFDLCIIFLKNLLNHYIPLLREHSDSYADILALDIRFYLLTVYTHIGELQEIDTIEKECDLLIAKLPTSLEGINYRIKYETRKIIKLINSFEFEAALVKADELVNKCKEIKEMLGLISDEQPHYDELGKALGTRLQIKTFMLRKDYTLYESAKQDSEDAIAEFTSQEDIQRQYIYRASLETEHGDYDGALFFLRKSVSLEPESSIKELCSALCQKNVFGVNAYIKLMAEARDWDKSDKMRDALVVNSYIQEIEAQSKRFHPFQLIFWKYGSYCAQGGMMRAAIDYYDKAIDVCFSSEEFTMNVIGLGICFEKIAMQMKSNLDANATIRQLRKKWGKLAEVDEGILKRVFGDTEFDLKESDYYFEKSRRITY